jgi:hypothetical protein
LPGGESPETGTVVEDDDGVLAGRRLDESLFEIGRPDEVFGRSQVL